MDRAQPNKTGGGDADGARVPPKAAHEDKEEKLLQDELDHAASALGRPAADEDGQTGCGPASGQTPALRPGTTEDGDGHARQGGCHQIGVRWKFWNERDGVGPRWPW